MSDTKYNLGTTRAAASTSSADVRAAAWIAARQAREFLSRPDIQALLARGQHGDVYERASIEFSGLALEHVRRALSALAFTRLVTFSRRAQFRAGPQPYLSSRTTNGPNRQPTSITPLVTTRPALSS